MITRRQEYIKRKDEIFFYHSNANIDTSSKIFNSRISNNLNDKSKINIGKFTLIRGAEILVYAHGGEISIGDYCFIGENSKIWSSKRITIGNRVLISHNVNIHDNNSHPMNPSERHEEFKKIFFKGLPLNPNGYNEKSIEIQDDVWIGFNSTIMKGVTIGAGAIIGANTLVTKDVPAGAIVVGNPSKITGYIEQ